MPKENNSGFQKHTKAYGLTIGEDGCLSLCGKLIPQEHIFDEPAKADNDCERCDQIWDMDHKGMEDTGDLDETSKLD